MKKRDIEYYLLLESSGELSPEQARELEEALAAHPEWAESREELAVWSEAGRLASREEVPPLPETTAEALRRKAEDTRRGPGRWLALAALVMIGLALWPHLPRPARNPDPARVTALDPVADPVPDTLLEADPVLEELEDLDREIQSLASIDLDDSLETASADYWAQQLLAMEDS